MSGVRQQRTQKKGTLRFAKYNERVEKALLGDSPRREGEGRRHLSANEILVYLHLLRRCRVPGSEPSDADGLVVQRNGHRVTNSELSRVLGIDNSRISGAKGVLSSLRARKLIEFDERQIRVLNLRYLSGVDESSTGGMDESSTGGWTNPPLEVDEPSTRELPRVDDSSTRMRASSDVDVNYREGEDPTADVGGSAASAAVSVLGHGQAKDNGNPKGTGPDDGSDRRPSGSRSDSVSSESSPEGPGQLGSEWLGVLSSEFGISMSMLRGTGCSLSAGLARDLARVIRHLSTGPDHRIRNPAGYVIALLRKGPDAVARVVDDHIDAAILAERKASRRSASEPEPPSEPTERPGGPEPVEDAERWMGIDLPSEMRSDYVRSKTARLLRRFGIPLTAAFFRYQDADFPLDRIVTGIRARLNAMVADGRPADVFDVARQSVVMSPYPDWFPFLDWRESLSDLWASVGATDQPWWRDHDYVGSPYGEFETLRAEMPPGSSSELPGGASGSSPPDPEGLPDPLPSDAMAG